MDDMRVVLRDCTPRSLVMIDELGKGEPLTYLTHTLTSTPTSTLTSTLTPTSTLTLTSTLTSASTSTLTPLW